MKKSLVVILGLAFLAVPLGQVAFSQEEAAKPAVPAAAPAAAAPAEEETDYSFGTVKSVSGDQMVVSEYDYESDKDVDVTYAADPAVKLENVDAVANIKAGDSVEIDFVTKDGKKVAKTISVEKPTEEEAGAKGNTEE